jgi:Flp pilus assembly protein TadD
VTPARWERRVEELERLGHTERALDVVVETLEHHPGEPRVLLRQIHLLGTLGRFDEAEEPLRILRLAEGNALEVRRAAGVLYFRRGMYPEAETELRAALRAGDPSGQSHYYLGEALNRLGMVEEALRILAQAVDLNPSETRAYNTMGRLLDRKGLPEEAAVMYRKARESSR